jgi:5-methylthioadenosine/S-adenosylhomocysteine deaminase
MNSLLITNGNILTLDDNDRMLRPGWIQIEAGRIEALGAGDPPGSAHRAGEIIDASGDVIMPGLVNAHTHLFQTFARGLGDDLPLLEWVERAILPITTHMTADDARAAATVGLIENLRSGATSVIEHQYVHTDPGIDDAICAAALDTGSRMCLARGWGDVIEHDVYRETIDEFSRATRAVHARWDGAEDRLSVELGPMVPWACSDEAMAASHDLASQLQCGTHIHLAETEAEVEMSLHRTGLRHVEWLQEHGWLGPQMQLAHGVWLDADELDLVAASGATVVHCPVSNMYLASGVAPVVEMLDRGINVALATDGPGSNNSQDMFEAMKAAVLLQKVHRLNATALAPLQVLHMACRGGAVAFGEADHLGALAPGYRGDVIIVDLATAFSVPVHDTRSALVFNASARDVKTVIVGGNVVIRDRQLTTLDEQEVLAHATSTCRDLFDRAGLTSEVNRS